MNGYIIDVSEWNENVNFGILKSENDIDSVIIRAGYGKKNIDSMFVRHITNALDNDFKVGVYWFSYAYNEDMARNEAIATIQTVKDFKITLPIFFDFEYDSFKYAKEQLGRELTKSEITNMCKVFCQTIEANGYQAGYYANTDYLNNFIDESQLEDYYLWYAWYTDDKPCDRDCALWQFSSQAQLVGVGGKVDLNKVFDENIYDGKESDMDYSKFPVLKIGITSQTVGIIQHIIGLPTTNIFDILTDMRVKEYQKSKGLSADGIVGQKTWYWIIQDMINSKLFKTSF